jgi:hypothetical protein
MASVSPSGVLSGTERISVAGFELLVDDDVVSPVGAISLEAAGTEDDAVELSGTATEYVTASVVSVDGTNMPCDVESAHG